MRSHSPDVRVATIARIGAALFLTATLACDSTTGPDATLKTPEAPAARIMPGQIVFVDHSNSSISVADSNGSIVKRLSVGSFDFDPAVSADGTRIAFSRSESGVQGVDLWVMNADGSNQVRLTHAVTAGTWRSNNSPAWSPDRKRIAFVTSTNDGTQIFVMNADGSDMKQLTDDSMGNRQPEWSPDGSRILFSRSQGTFEMNPDGSDIHSLFSGCCATTPTRSPDGTRFAFISSSTLFVMDADGSNLSTLTDGVDGNVDDLAWSPDGESIVFAIASKSTCNDWDCDYDQDLRRIRLDGVLLPHWKLPSASNPVWQR